MPQIGDGRQGDDAPQILLRVVWHQGGVDVRHGRAHRVADVNDPAGLSGGFGHEIYDGR